MLNDGIEIKKSIKKHKKYLELTGLTYQTRDPSNDKKITS
jgi:hypothetical protein